MKKRNILLGLVVSLLMMTTAVVAIGAQTTEEASENQFFNLAEIERPYISLTEQIPLQYLVNTGHTTSPTLVRVPSFESDEGSQTIGGEKPLPHIPEDLIREDDPESDPEQPYAVHADRSVPTTGDIDSPSEYNWMDGILLRWISGHWTDVITDLAYEAADEPNDSKAYIVVASGQQSTCQNALTNAGVDISQVEFINDNSESIWIRDYGPHFIWQDNTRAISDSFYYKQRPNDNAVPYEVAEYFKMPYYDMTIMYSGGNLLTTDNQHAYISSLIYNDNPGITAQQIADTFYQFQGIETVHIFDKFPFNIDGTGHIDMWMSILADDIVMIGQYQEISPTYPPYVITEAAVTYMQNLGFTVYRLPGWNSGSGGYNGVHYTYTNGIILNDKILVPQYGGSYTVQDSRAMSSYAAAMPGYDIIGVNAASIISAAGAFHCVCMHVPSYEDSSPSVKVLSPNGGELWGADTFRDIKWAADDDVQVREVDIYLSLDEGATYPYTIATAENNDGIFENYQMPWKNSNKAKVKVVVRDADLNEVYDESDTLFKVKKVKTKTYDFSTGAGVDKFGYGGSSNSWSQHLEGNRTPANCQTPINQIYANAYTQIATSNNLRFSNPKPTYSYQENTLIFEFNIKEPLQFATGVKSLEFLWEGYAQSTQHMRLYIWDYTEGNWGDGKGNYGYDAFIDNGTYNTDRELGGQIVVTDTDRYVTADGEVTFLVLNDRDGNNIVYTDYVSLYVQSIPYVEKPKELGEDDKKPIKPGTP